MLTGKQLAEFCLKVHAAGWVYWYGTCGYKCTTSLYNSKKKQYPDAYTASRESGYKKDIANGAMCADCVGLIKAAFWTGCDINGKSVRGANNCPDTNANGMYKLCKENGPISTIPDEPGLVVWKSGHIGVYVGNGYTVEMKGFAYDCQKNKVTSGKWTNWGRLPASMLAYDGSGLPAAPTYKLGERELRKGCEGDDVAELQAALAALGYELGTYGPQRDGIDGDYGSKTAAAVKAFQKAAGLTADGIYGPKSHAALAAMREDSEPENATYTITIPGVDAATASYLLEAYKGATAAQDAAQA